MKSLSLYSYRQGRSGFTAMEMAMVAAIIAMFALLVLPQFRARVDEARITAAKSDLDSFMKAEMLARAELGAYLRLEDLDNVQDNIPATGMPANGVTNEVPFFKYSYNVDPTQAANREGMSQAQWRSFAKQFKGPYATFPQSITLTDMRNVTLNPIGAYVLRSTTGNTLAPIQDMTSNANGGPVDSLDNKLPLDPWGNPYLFYPATGDTGTEATSFYDSLLVSLGPDGLPGTRDGNNAADYLRSKVVGWTGVGTTNTNSDDIVLIF